MMKKLTIFAFAGPSGSGKTELVARLLAAYPENCRKWRQVTTRDRRSPTEDYLFVTDSQYASIKDMLTCRTHFYGKSYGTFVEPAQVTEEVAILTIVSREGLQDLARDVEIQNERGTWKFGQNVKVNLVPVLMTYEVNEQSTAERGRLERGADKIHEELLDLQRLGLETEGFWQIVVDTSSQWPDPVKFFEESVWPALAAESDEEKATKLREEIAAELTRIAGIAKETVDLQALERLHGTVVVVGNAAKPQGRPVIQTAPVVAADDIDVALSAPPAHEDGAVQMADPNEAERVYSQSIAAAEVAEAALEKAAQVEEEDSGELQHPTDYLNDRPVATEVTAVVEETPEPTPAPEVPTEAAVVGAATLSGLVASGSSFDDWVLAAGVGAGAFQSEAAFRAQFGNYLAEYGLGGDVVVASQKTKDGAGGQITEFRATFNGETYVIEFNHRLNRVANQYMA